MTPTELLSARRDELDVSRAALGRAVAKRVGRATPYTSEAVRKWEVGLTKPGSSVVQALDDVLGLGGELVSAFGVKPTMSVGDATLDDIGRKLDALMLIAVDVAAVLRRLAGDEPDPGPPTRPSSPQGRPALERPPGPTRL